MKKILISAWLLAVMAVPAAGMAAASTHGTTGAIDTPTADILNSGQVSVSYHKLHEGSTYSVGVGLGNRLEAAAAHNLLDGADDFSELNLKYALQRDGIIKPGLALGVDDVLDERERSVYAVLSKGLPLGIRMNLGVGNGRYNGLFGSLEKQIIKGKLGKFPTTVLLLENDGRSRNYGLRLSLTQQVKLQLGYRDSDAYVGLSGSF